MTTTAIPQLTPVRVSTLELFFDLVFAFTVTQVAQIIVDSPGVEGIARAGVELAVIFWMYAGYAWLTNTSDPNSPMRRLVLLAGMAAFFVAALCVLHAFGDNGIVFGIAYVAINVVHGFGFLVYRGGSAWPAVRQLLPWNMVSAGLILAAGWTHGALDWAFWVGAVAIQWLTPVLARVRTNYRINTNHFAERHGLIILIVLGESLISIGIAGEHDRVTLRIVLGVLAGLVAVAIMWLLYFVHDDDWAATALDRAEPQRRPILAVAAYFFAHLVMIFGVLALAAGTRLSAVDLTAHAPRASAWLVAAGGALYLAGSAGFRHTLRFGTPVPRGLAAIICLAATPVGTRVSPAVELVTVGAVMGCAMAVEHSPRVRATSRSGRMPA